MPRFGLSSRCRLSVYREEGVACSHFTDSDSGHVAFDWPGSNATPLPSMRETVWEIACNKNGIDVQQIAIGSQSSESKSAGKDYPSVVNTHLAQNSAPTINFLQETGAGF